MATFRRNYLENEFKKLNDELPEHVDLYLIGGGAMSFQNLKVATKDIDVVLKSARELEPEFLKSRKNLATAIDIM